MTLRSTPRPDAGPPHSRWARAVFGLGIMLILAAMLEAQQGGALEPTDKVIRYLSSDDLRDPLTLLNQRIKTGKLKLEYEPEHGYLKSLLRELNVPIESQTLVFSKTSNQAGHTSPRTPRALYYNDRVYIGWAQGDDFIDVASIDPKKGPIFFTLEQSPTKPEIRRDVGCMQCHITPKTLNVPGILLRSVYAMPDGKAVGQVNGFVSGHNNPLKDRWGGWYVTGTHGDDVHMGNAFLAGQDISKVDLKPTSDVTRLDAFFDTSKYLVATSDTVSLLVLDHISRMQNMLTLARYETMYALQDQAKSPDYAHDRIARAGEQLLVYMLFRNEAAMHGPIKGTSSFTEEFQRGGPRDHEGRSLRQLDLQTRLFRYPCSYLIYSPSFDELPREMKEYIWGRLQVILGGKDTHPYFQTLSAEDRRAVYEILIDTKPEFRDWCRAHRT